MSLNEALKLAALYRSTPIAGVMPVPLPIPDAERCESVNWLVVKGL